MDIGTGLSLLVPLRMMMGVNTDFVWFFSGLLLFHAMAVAVPLPATMRTVMAAAGTLFRRIMLVRGKVNGGVTTKAVVPVSHLASMRPMFPVSSVPHTAGMTLTGVHKFLVALWPFRRFGRAVAVRSVGVAVLGMAVTAAATWLLVITIILLLLLLLIILFRISSVLLVILLILLLLILVIVLRVLSVLLIILLMLLFLLLIVSVRSIVITVLPAIRVLLVPRRGRAMRPVPVIVDPVVGSVSVILRLVRGRRPRGCIL
jgi:hypothetical protein